MLVTTMSKGIIILLLAFIVIPVYDVFGYTFVGVTSNGVEFSIESTSSNSTDTGDGDSILDGIGVYLTIQNRDTNGVVYFGNEQTDIRPYVEINELDDWAVVIDDGDSIEALIVDEFAKQYTYVGGSLIDTSVDEPNILGYTESRVLSGDVDVVITDDGIVISGDGNIILKLDDYSNQSVYLRGNNANVLSVITSDFDLINDTYYSDGYLIYSNNIDPSSNSFSVDAGIDSIHTGIIDYTTYFEYNNANKYGVCHFSTSSWLGYDLYGTPDDGGTDNCYYEYPWSMTTSLVKIDNSYFYTITGDNTTPETFSEQTSNSYVYNEGTSDYSFYLYDTLPSYQIGNYGIGDFEELLYFPNEQTYLYVEVNGESTTIKGEDFDVGSDIYFQVDGLPANVGYDITKDGITGMIGQTDSNGLISLLFDDVDFGITTSLGGMLNLYTDSLTYNGDYGLVMFDLLHGNTTQLFTSDDLLYIPQNYIYWVFPISVQIDNVRIDNTNLDYLSGYYEENESLYIPVIPDATTLYVTIDGEDITVLMRDVEVGTQIKQVPQETSTSSVTTVDGTASVSSNISTSTFMIATHTGDMYVNFDFKVGGSVDFTMDSTYTGDFTASESCSWHGASSPSRTHSCRTYVTPSNPSDITNMETLTAEHQTQITDALNNGQASQITVEVDILINMRDDDARTILIYTSDSSEAFVTSTFYEAGYGVNNQVHVSYPLDLVSENIFIPVTVGDMVEFVIRVNLEGSGSPTPMSNSASYSSYAQVTTELGGGIITVGMS